MAASPFGGMTWIDKALRAKIPDGDVAVFQDPCHIRRHKCLVTQHAKHLDSDFGEDEGKAKIEGHGDGSPGLVGSARQIGWVPYGMQMPRRVCSPDTYRLSKACAGRIFECGGATPFWKA